jgi:hypothetical protein
MSWILNCIIYNKMKPTDNLNPSQENQEDQNPNPPPPHNVNTKIDEGSVIL